MTQDIRIRRATVEDAEDIARVHVETWQSTYAGIVPDGYLVGLSQQKQTRLWRDLLSRETSGETVLLVEHLEADGRTGVIGFGSGGSARDGSLLYDGEIYTLYVLPDWQGQGIGQRLLATLFRTLYDRGMEDALLWVLAGNPTRFFYEHMGGLRIAEREEALGGTAVPAVAYGWTDLDSWLRQVGA
jgi:GNAT superfamily N-acetyltransferase